MFGSKLEKRQFKNRILKYVPLYNQAFYYNDLANIDRYHIIREGIALFMDFVRELLEYLLR